MQLQLQLLGAMYLNTNSFHFMRHYQSNKISVEAIDATIKPKMTMSAFVLTTLIDPFCFPKIDTAC